MCMDTNGNAGRHFVRVHQCKTPAFQSVQQRGSQRRNEQHCIFHYTVRDSGEVLYEGQTYRTAPGQGFFHIINDPLAGYGYPAGAVEPWEFVVISFSGGNSRAMTKELMERQVLYDLSAHIDAFRKLVAELSGSILTRDVGMSFIFRLLNMLPP